MERRLTLPLEFDIPRKKQQTLEAVIHKAESFAGKNLHERKILI